MFNVNSGYIGQKRSIHSQKAMDQLEVPQNQITRTTINQAIEIITQNKQEQQFLAKIPISYWKSQPATSWHHTGKYFQKTDHYNLIKIGQYFLNSDHNKLLAKINYIKAKKLVQKYQPSKLEYVIYAHNIWAGTRNHPYIKYTENGFGVKLEHEKRIYPVACNRVTNITKKDQFSKSFYTTGIKDRFTNYQELINKYPEYKNTKIKLNNTIKLNKLKHKLTKQEQNKLDKYQLQLIKAKQAYDIYFT